MNRPYVQAKWQLYRHIYICVPHVIRFPHVIFIYTTHVIFELVGAPVGRSNVLHGLLEFAKLRRIV